MIKDPPKSILKR